MPTSSSTASPNTSAVTATRWGAWWSTRASSPGRITPSVSPNWPSPSPLTTGWSTPRPSARPPSSGGCAPCRCAIPARRWPPWTPSCCCRGWRPWVCAWSATWTTPCRWPTTSSITPRWPGSATPVCRATPTTCWRKSTWPAAPRPSSRLAWRRATRRGCASTMRSRSSSGWSTSATPSRWPATRPPPPIAS